jgi:hypothetical protein
MATKVHLVKKSRVDNAAVKRGEQYWWWKLPFGEKTVSSTYPVRSQLTNSDYLGCVFDLEDQIHDFTIDNASDFEAMLEEVTEVIGDIQEQCQTNYDNMAPMLHAAPNGKLLAERLRVIPELLEELDALDYSDHIPGTDFDYMAFIAVLKKLEVTRVGKVIKLYGEGE